MLVELRNYTSTFTFKLPAGASAPAPSMPSRVNCPLLCAGALRIGRMMGAQRPAPSLMRCCLRPLASARTQQPAA